MFFVVVLTSAKSTWLQLGTLVLLDAEEEAVEGFLPPGGDDDGNFLICGEGNGV